MIDHKKADELRNLEDYKDQTAKTGFISGKVKDLDLDVIRKLGRVE
jgi:hypothetical protein